MLLSTFLLGASISGVVVAAHGFGELAVIAASIFAGLFLGLTIAHVVLFLLKTTYLTNTEETAGTAPDQTVRKSCCG